MQSRGISFYIMYARVRERTMSIYEPEIWSLLAIHIIHNYTQKF